MGSSGSSDKIFAITEVVCNPDATQDVQAYENVYWAKAPLAAGVQRSAARQIGWFSLIQKVISP